MSRDLSRMKVLMTHSKLLTPAQQSWPPLSKLTLSLKWRELRLRCSVLSRHFVGLIMRIWLGLRAATSELVKLVRWVSEILADGSEIRSLSGRSAKLGDGFSRNPAGRDELLEARTTKDIGRCRSVEEVQFGRVSWRRYGDRLKCSMGDSGWRGLWSSGRLLECGTCRLFRFEFWL